jgi:hypothetical protein
MGQNEEKYILSYGGGLNSSSLLVFIIENKPPLDEVIFADTGTETPETYEAVKYFRAYCEKNKIPFVVVRADETLYDYYFKKMKIPSIDRRDCTIKYKIFPINKYIKQKYGKNRVVHSYIGIDYGEATRMKTSDDPNMILEYPLVFGRIDRAGCEKILKHYGHIVPMKSGCYVCPFGNNKRWKFIYEKHPDLYEAALLLEERCKKFPKVRLHRRTLRELKKNLNVKDSSPEPTCDVVGGCFL